MENRHLYRGKRADNGEWVEGYYVKGLDMHDKEVYMIFEPGTIFYSSGETDGWVEVEASTICRCTAMPDKNKKLVFEHDIVWDSDERAFYEIIWNQEDMCWNVEDADGHKSEFEECYGNTIEVNGNRFDNPELFEVNCFQNGNS